MTKKSDPIQITPEQVEYVAHLARLALEPDEKAQLARELGHILAYIAKLNQLDTARVEPTSHVLPIRNVFREDQVKSSLPRETLLENAPDQAGEYFRVPRIIE